jgi:MoxR-like ATPase
LNDLSPAAVEAFEKMRNFTDSTVATASSSDKAKRSIDDLGAAMVSLGDTGFVRFMNEAAVQALTVEASFYAQAQSADSLAKSLNDMADSGTGNMEAMIRSAESARATMDLLDQTRLDSLQSAIDRARGSMDSLRESSEAALEAAQRALAQQQGDQRALIELDRKQKIAELDKQLAAAQAANDQESINKLQQALDLEQQTYELKKKVSLYNHFKGYLQTET